MEVLNAAGVLTPTSLHKTERRPAAAEPKKLLLPFKIPRNFKTFTSSIAALSSALFANGLARALTYEEALSQSVSNPPGDFDIGQLLNGIDPLVVGGGAAVLAVPPCWRCRRAGGAAVLAVPLVLSRVLGKPKSWGAESAKSAYAKLGEDAGAQLLDIRGGREMREVGGPDVKGLKKKAVAVAYRGDDKNGFLNKLGLRFKDPKNTTLFILDKFDGNSELVAELATANGFKTAYAIKDGVEGPRGWLNSGLPWTAPKMALSVDFGDLKDALTNAIGGDTSDSIPVTLGLAAATSIGLFAFTEIETVLQVLGSAAIIQLVTKKLLFAEDLKATLQQVDEYLNTKIAPNELFDDIKMIGKALLPAPITISTKSLPAPTQEYPETSTSADPVLKADSVPVTKPEVKKEAPAQPSPVVNSVLQSEVSDGSLPSLSRPLSPYPYYPDFKPPSSPSPAQP